MKRLHIGVVVVAVVLSTKIRARNVLPPIDTQLQADDIDADSILARVVRQSQDAELLCDSEFDDHLGIPLWLRINWRKGHPEDHFRCDDPGYGYPRVLYEAYGWLVRHQDLKPSHTRAVLNETGRSFNPYQAGSITMAISTPHIESDVKINPANPMQVIAASNTEQNQAEFSSADGGMLWSESSLPLSQHVRRHADPGVAWAGGSAWSSAIAYLPRKTFVVRAFRFDNAKGWVEDATVSGSSKSADRPVIWGDSNTGNLYVVYSDDNKMCLARRVNSTWTSPQVISGNDSLLRPSGGDVTTNSAGDVYVFWPERRSDGKWHMLVRASTNGGGTFGAPSEIGLPFGRPSIDVPSFVHGAYVYVSAGAFSKNSARLVYASWTDLSGETDCRDQDAAQKGKDKTSSCKSRIWFTRLADGQAVWDAPWMINPAATKSDQFNQRLAVDPESGVIGIVYYDTVNDPDRLKAQLFFQYSVDNGDHWSAPRALSSAIDETSTPNADQYGDYNGLATFKSVFVPSWTNRSGGGAEQIWTAVQSCVYSPPNVTASPAPGQIHLVWSVADGVSGYLIMRSRASGGAYAEIGTVPGATSSYTDAAVAAGEKYFYVIKTVGVCESASAEVAIIAQ
jgi:hypothetical protein